MPEVEGGAPLPGYLHRPDATIDRSRACTNPHPTVDQLEELRDTLPWYWFNGYDAMGRPFRIRVFDCPICHGSGVIQPEPGEIDREMRRHLRVEDSPFDHPSRRHEQWSPSYGSGDGRR